MINNNLPPGNYLYRWNGKNENGVSVSSGVYIANLRVANKISSTKIVFLK